MVYGVWCRLWPPDVAANFQGNRSTDVVCRCMMHGRGVLVSIAIAVCHRHCHHHHQHYDLFPMSLFRSRPRVRSVRLFAFVSQLSCALTHLQYLQKSHIMAASVASTAASSVGLSSTTSAPTSTPFCGVCGTVSEDRADYQELLVTIPDVIQCSVAGWWALYFIKHIYICNIYFTLLIQSSLNYSAS